MVTLAWLFTYAWFAACTADCTMLSSVLLPHLLADAAVYRISTSCTTAPALAPASVVAPPVP